MDTHVNRGRLANSTLPSWKPVEFGGNPNEIANVSPNASRKRPRSASKDSPAKEDEGIGQAIVPIEAVPCSVVLPTSSPCPVSCKQFWRAGDYEGPSSGGGGGDWQVSAGGFDHVRVHPKFLHSNATSHKWALGAFAELLDNALDEVHSGATYVNVDMLKNRKDGNRMILIEDNGGGMNPEKMRHCMSLGYSAKSKLANTIGQYGNGFKTSTMRLGADVIVFSRCQGKDGKGSTQSIGLLSYTFLTSTGKEDIVVPMLDYERRSSKWSPIIRSSVGDWDKNVETVVQWSPFSAQEDLLRQFNLMKDHGTRIIIYNLWEDDQGMLELDFDTDPHDIQLRGANRDENSIDMATKFPNSRHFLTYKHSLRSYASILYLKFPSEFRIILRGRDVEHHNIVNDMMLTDRNPYKPKDGADMSTVVTIGFVKDAKHHVDVQGFNVYHKNRLIKPFWRLWNAAGSDGRGVIGVLEANFVEPAHDKQGFERTTVLSRLETRLIQMQKTYWRSKCHIIGYASRTGKKSVRDSEDRESSPEFDSRRSLSSRKASAFTSFKSPTTARRGSVKGCGPVSSEKVGKLENTSSKKSNKRLKTQSTSAAVTSSDDDSGYVPPSPEIQHATTEKASNKSNKRLKPQSASVAVTSDDVPSPEVDATELADKVHAHSHHNVTLPKAQSGPSSMSELEQENKDLKDRLNKKEDVFMLLQNELRREKELRKKLEAEVERTKDKLEEMMVEQESLIGIFSEDRDKRDKEEEDIRNKLEEAKKTIQDLLANGKPPRR